MAEKQIILFEDYVRDHFDEYRAWRTSNLTRALVNTLLANLRTTQVSLIRSLVVTPEQVAGHNHDQGALVALESIINILTEGPPPEPEAPEDNEY